MIKVNDYWENADTLEDISGIIREHYNPELADIMDGLLCRINDSSENNINRLNELEEIIENVKDLVRYL